MLLLLLSVGLRLGCASLLFLRLSGGSSSGFSAIVHLCLPLPLRLASTLQTVCVSAFVTRSTPLGVFLCLRLLPLRPCTVSFFPWPCAYFFWHIGWRCSFFACAVSCYMLLLILGACWLSSLLWIISLSPFCTSSFHFGSSPGSKCCSLLLCCPPGVWPSSSPIRAALLMLPYFSGLLGLVPIHRPLSASASRPRFSSLVLVFLLGGLCPSSAWGSCGRSPWLLFHWFSLFHSGFFRFIFGLLISGLGSFLLFP